MSMQSDQALLMLADQLKELIMTSLKMIMDSSKKWKVDYSILEIQQVSRILNKISKVPYLRACRNSLYQNNNKENHQKKTFSLNKYAYHKLYISSSVYISFEIHKIVNEKH